MQSNRLMSFASAAALLILVGCDRSRPETAPARPAHPDVPFAAAQLSTEWDPSPSRAYTTTPGGSRGSRYVDEGPGPVLPPPPGLPPARLAELLPQPPQGWWAEQGNVETSVVDDRTHYQTMAQRSYAKRWAPSAPTVSLAIRVDWGAAQTLKTEFDAICARHGAACKPVTTAIGNGHEIEVGASQWTELSILVQPNVVVHAWGQGVTAGELRAWAEKIPADRLGKMVLPAQ